MAKNRYQTTDPGSSENTKLDKYLKVCTLAYHSNFRESMTKGKSLKKPEKGHLGDSGKCLTLDFGLRSGSQGCEIQP